MKRRFFMLALAGLVGFSFVGTSCGDDDDDDTTPVVKPDNQKPDDQKPDDQKPDDQKPDDQKPEETKKNHVLVIKAKDRASEDWDSQFWLVSNTVFNNGDTWEISMKVKSQVAVEETRVNGEGKEFTVDGIGTQLHEAPGAYAHWNAIGNVPFTTEWKTFTKTGTFDGIPDGKECKSIAFNLNYFTKANEYYFDDISFKVNGTEVLSNGKFEKDDFSSFVYKLAGENLGEDGGAGIVEVTSAMLSETDEIVITETPAE
jgi:hypothetical protein